MPRKLFTDRTILHLSSHLANNYSLAQIRDLFIDLNLSTYEKFDRLMHPPMSKKNYCMTILNEENADSNDIIFDDLFKRTIKGASSDLKQALELDGWDVTEYGVESLAGKLAEPSSEHSVLIDKLSDRSMNDIIKYFNQSFDNYTESHFESANAMIRTTLEAIVSQCAKLVSQQRSEIIPMSNPHHYNPIDYRKYLKIQVSWIIKNMNY